MNENSKKWKSRLLSSSIPLEFEVAKILSKLGFSVSYDYAFLRKEGTDFKEFSTDIHAVGFYPLKNDDKVEAIFDMLVECKYREEGKRWLFLPETNREGFSVQTLGCTIRHSATFTQRRIKKDKIYSQEEMFEFVLKGVEVNSNSGDVFDKDIRHGIHQLKYAMPYIIQDHIESNLYCHIEDAKPWFSVPILLTNADLCILHKNTSIDSIKKSEKIDDISQIVPYLICYSDIGPEFTEHHKYIFKNFYTDNIKNENLQLFEAAQKKFLHKNYNIYDSPLEECWELQSSFKSKLIHNYSHFFVCTFEHFEDLTRKILSTISKSMK